MYWDRVLTINNYHDRPILGVANVEGVPHIYELEFDNIADEYGEIYLVSPINQDLLSLILEDWAIWQRWHTAYIRKKVSIETHPCIPEDFERHNYLKAAIADRFHADKKLAIRLKGEFRNVHKNRGWDDAEVRWFS